MKDVKDHNRLNVASLLMKARERFGDRPAVADRAETLDYATLADRVLAAASALAELGIKSGDRVAIIVDKQVDIVAWVFGCFAAEAVLVPINPLLRPRQVRHIVADSGARLLVAAEKRRALLGDLAETDSLPLVLEREGASAWKLSTQRVLPDRKAPPPGFDTPKLATLFYTSGSTGLPKAVACTHANIVAGAESVSSYLENTAEDVILAILPLSFDAGFSQLTTGFHSGAKVILRDYLLPRDISRSCEEEGVTGITGVPAIWTAALKARWQEAARARLRYFANTGGHLPPERINQLMDLFPNAKPFPMYGLTEAFRSAYLSPEKVRERPGSIGKAIPGAQLFVLDDAGEICAPGQPGELVHVGPTVALGYWNNPEETARRFRPAPPSLQRLGIHGKVVFSGDEVTCDAEGYLYYLGRRDGQIKIAGNRISFTEVEDVALKVDGVKACAAGGRPAPTPGTDPSLVLFVEGKGRDKSALASEIDATLRRELPSYTVPSEIVILDKLIVNPNGKYDVGAMLKATASLCPSAEQEG